MKVQAIITVFSLACSASIHGSAELPKITIVAQQPDSSSCLHHDDFDCRPLPTRFTDQKDACNAVCLNNVQNLFSPITFNTASSDRSTPESELQTASLDSIHDSLKSLQSSNEGTQEQIANLKKAVDALNRQHAEILKTQNAILWYLMLGGQPSNNARLVKAHENKKNGK